MTALAWFRIASRARRRGLAVCAGALTVSACLLVTGCSSGSPASSSMGFSGDHAAAAGPAARAPASGGSGAAASGLAAPSASVPGQLARGGPPQLTSLAPGDLIRTASLTVSTGDVATAVSRATAIAQAAGGYVSGEQSFQGRGRDPAVVSIQFKVPPAVYQSTLTSLASLGSKRGETQRTQDVTQTVADVTSRVASAKAAIAQLRKLLAHAGTVSGLLTVQDQINQEEASLESLLSQQRALAAQTSLATISMVIEGKAPPVHHHHRHHKPAVTGFLGGLKTGWHALLAVTKTLLTLVGAVLPFAVIAALLALGAIVARRRIARRRPTASPEVTGTATG